ncbi:hypothetical protein [Pasteuria penetrans]|uniref:hypothetical protein n=1 Tax=Pasteuria penetrans TaxID=86005 RepID=UPI0011F08DA6|nr:hypothetical protein [Pasteuria penetrans]
MFHHGLSLCLRWPNLAILFPHGGRGYRRYPNASLFLLLQIEFLGPIFSQDLILYYEIDRPECVQTRRKRSFLLMVFYHKISLISMSDQLHTYRNKQHA